MTRTRITRSDIDSLGLSPANRTRLLEKLADHDAVADRIGSVLDYGALGTGGDDTEAVQDALDALAGGVVYFPAGVYGKTQTWLVDSNTLVLGDGAGRSIVRGLTASYTGVTEDGTDAYAAFACIGKHHVTFRGLTIDHVTNSTNANGIVAVPGNAYTGAPCEWITVEDCEVLGYEAHQYLIWTMRGRHVRILNNRCDGGPITFAANSNQEGIEVFGGYDVLVQGNVVQRIDNGGINCGAAEGQPRCEIVGLRILDNHVENCRIGINLGTAYDDTYGAQSLSDILVAGNVIESSYETGILLKKTSPLTALTNIAISDNAIKAGPVAIQLYGIEDEETDEGVSVRGNVIEGATTTTLGALTALYMFRARIDGNVITDSAGEAMHIIGDIGSAIVNNTVVDAQKQAVAMDDCNGTVVARNHFADYGLGLATGGLLSTNSVLVVVKDNEWEQVGVGTDVIVSGTSGIVTGNVSVASGAAIPFTNTTTNKNFGTTAAMTATETTIDVTTTLANNGSRFVVSQATGAPLAFKVARISGGFRITVASAAAGDETFAWEVF